MKQAIGIGILVAFGVGLYLVCVKIAGWKDGSIIFFSAIFTTAIVTVGIFLATGAI